MKETLKKIIEINDKILLAFSLISHKTIEKPNRPIVADTIAENP